MKKLLSVFTILLLLTSCESTVYKDFEEFDNYQWEKSKTPEFNFEITEKAEKYDIILTLRYVEGFPYKNMIGTALLVDEHKNASLKKVFFPIIDDNKNYIGEVAGDLWDTEYTLFNDTSLEKGKYKITTEQLVVNPILAFVVDVGIKVKKVDK
jgi:gliding motility-associated lipoprotein GldH